MSTPQEASEWTPLGYITDETVFTSTDDLTALREHVAPTARTIEFTVASGLMPSWLLDLRDAEPRYTLTTATTRPVALRTGPRRGRRVDHARQLRLDKWKRRRQRKHGIPAAVVHTWITYPRVEVVFK